ncbi:SDR family NAD(P)-dependent oxidoreductase [Nocardioides sp. Bht2]|uniref:SDR family NAD(P)-dependent oxidoreductase n=1 Tax=Nocardioides sp. Bht2 TaxID=3392297 RepID=UPI0039B47A5D
MNRYTDRRVLITGAGSGIGQATTLRVLAEGAWVAAADISATGLADTLAKAGPLAERITPVTMDVADEQSVIDGVARAQAALGGLDAVVNAAGILRSSHTVTTSVADFERVLRVNLVGTFVVIRESIGALREGDGPAVVNFSSTSAQFAHPYMAAYAASKGGIQSMTHALAAEFGGAGIRFNSVQPGGIATGMTTGETTSEANAGPGLPEDADYRLFAKMSPALGDGSFATPDAVAAVVAMLASKDAYFVTGTEVRVDGGAHF